MRRSILLAGSLWLAAAAGAQERPGAARFVVYQPKGDVRYEPAAAVCARLAERYRQGFPLPGAPAFKERGFWDCRVVESREGRGPADCPRGESLAGCDICEMECS